MDADRAIRAFAKARRELPFRAMLWCRDNWPAAAPRFLDLLARYTDGRDRSETAAGALLFILHLFAEHQETRAFATMCRLAHDTDAIVEVLSEDGVTESLGSLLMATFDGDPDPLKRLIETPTVDEFIRVEALNALGYLTASGRLAADATAGYLGQLFATLQPQTEHIVWFGWAQVATWLRVHPELVDQAFARGFVPPEWGSIEDIRDMRREALGDPDLRPAFERERIGPIDDAIDELSQWAAFSGEDDADDDPAEDDDELDVFDPLEDGPAVNPFKNVGRNDPCPCGSGKKFKKCCLGAPD